MQKYGDYLAASKFGFPDGHWWQFLVGLSEHFGICPAYVGEFGEGPTDVLVDWTIIFVVDGKRFGITARDAILTEKNWLEYALKDLEEFASGAQLTRAILVTRRANPPFAAGAETSKFPIVVGDQAPIAAREAFDLLMK